MYYENCSCDAVCPCTWSNMNRAATHEDCRVALLFEVEKGSVDGVDVAGNTCVVIMQTPAQMLEGNFRVGLIIGADASDEQADKLTQVFSGTIGGPMAGLSPLIADFIGVERMPHSHDVASEGRQPILVFSDKDRNMGLVVDDIVDIVEDRMKLELAVDQPGFLGSAVIDGKATEIVDVGHFLNQAFSDWFKAHDDQAFGGSGARHVLLVDDSPFFRNMLTPLLEVAGYAVTCVEDADAALTLRENGEAFDVIISDIEMPGMDGFDFAEEIKKDSRWQDTPIVALSSHASPQDVERGREVGFDDYVAKFDRDALFNSLSQTIAMSGGAA